MHGFLKKSLSMLITAAIILPMTMFTSSAAAYRWTGETELKEGNTYVIRDEVVVRENLFIPERTKLIVEDGGTLKIRSDVRLKGELIGTIGSTIELRKGSLAAINSKLHIYGTFNQYTETEIELANSRMTVYNRGAFTGSGNLKLYKDAVIYNKGSFVLTNQSIVTLSGSVESERSSTFRFQGIVNVTVSGAISSKGYLNIGRNAVVTNSGTITVLRLSEYTCFGELKNTKSGHFNDFRERYEYEQMTVSILQNEPDVMKKGIDVSVWQKEINWEKVSKSGVDFAIIRAGRGTTGDLVMKEDDMFARNITEANKHGVDVGVYFYSYATTVKEARAEAEFFVSIIDGYKITYPVILDMEENLEKHVTNLSKTLVTDMVEAFFEVLMDNGYYPMLYSYKSWFEEHLDMRILDKYAVWIAQINDKVTYQGGYYIWQYSWEGKVSGIEGDVDLNISYKDFPAILKKYKLNKL